MNKIISTLKGFFMTELSYTERRGMGAGTIAAILAASILLTSCTAETYAGDLEPISHGTDACIDSLPGSYLTGVVYDFTEYCTAMTEQDYSIEFLSGGEAIVTLPLGTGGTATINANWSNQNGFLFMFYEGGNTQSFRLSEDGVLYGQDFATGCTFAIH
jgi:hypothetical protein